VLRDAKKGRCITRRKRGVKHVPGREEGKALLRSTKERGLIPFFGRRIRRKGANTLESVDSGLLAQDGVSQDGISNTSLSGGYKEGELCIFNF